MMEIPLWVQERLNSFRALRCIWDMPCGHRKGAKGQCWWRAVAISSPWGYTPGLHGLNRQHWKFPRANWEAQRQRAEKEDGIFLGPQPHMVTKWSHKHFQILSLVASALTSPRNITFLTSRYHLRMVQWKVCYEIRRLHSYLKQTRHAEIGWSYAVKLYSQYSFVLTDTFFKNWNHDFMCLRLY